MVGLQQRGEGQQELCDARLALREQQGKNSDKRKAV